MLLRRRRKEATVEVETPKQEEVEVNPLLDGLTVPKLKDIAKIAGIEKYSEMTKPELLKALEGWNLDGYHSSEEPPGDQN